MNKIIIIFVLIESTFASSLSVGFLGGIHWAPHMVNDEYNKTRGQQLGLRFHLQTDEHAKIFCGLFFQHTRIHTWDSNFNERLFDAYLLQVEPIALKLFYKDININFGPDFPIALSDSLEHKFMVFPFVSLGMEQRLFSSISFIMEGKLLINVTSSQEMFTVYTAQLHGGLSLEFQ